MEKAILEKAAEIIKKGEGVGIDTLSNREKAMIIDALTCRYTIKQLLPSLHMAKSSYFYQIQAMKKDKYEIARKELRKVFSTNRQCYGYRRLHTALTSNGRTISEKVVLRLMHEEDLVVRSVKRRKYNSYKRELQIKELAAAIDKSGKSYENVLTYVKSDKR